MVRMGSVRKNTIWNICVEFVHVAKRSSRAVEVGAWFKLCIIVMNIVCCILLFYYRELMPVCV
jgi:hypothetical protein